MLKRVGLGAKEKILNALGSEPKPIRKVAEETDFSVQTTSKYLHILAAERKATMTAFGNMKLVTRR